MVWPDPADVAVLTIDGREYRDWESVQVRHAIRELPHFKVRFTCSEGMPLAKNFAALRIIPGQWCTVTLGGQPAVSGYVYTRQVFYDGRRHYIEIQAGSDTISLSYSSVTGQSMEAKKVTAEQYIKSLTGPVGIDFTVQGGKLPEIQFDRISAAPGATRMEQIEEVLRMYGNYPTTSKPEGGLVVLAGKRDGNHTFVEGVDILEGREIIQNLGMMSENYAMAQMEGNNQNRYGKITHIPFTADQAMASWSAGLAPLINILEMPSNNQKLIAGRALAERELQGSDLITVFVTVRGWLQPEGGLWKIYGVYRVKSPMLVMDGGMSLTAKSVTFTQDDSSDSSGTRTTLELCNDQALNESGTAGGLST